MIKNTIIAILSVVVIGLAIMSVDSQTVFEDDTWLLSGDRKLIVGEDHVSVRQGSNGVVAVLITSEIVDIDIVRAAWAYAVINSENEFDVPDYYRAIEIMLDRHPSWIASVTQAYQVGHGCSECAVNDMPEPEVTPDN